MAPCASSSGVFPLGGAVESSPWRVPMCVRVHETCIRPEKTRPRKQNPDGHPHCLLQSQEGVRQEQ